MSGLFMQIRTFFFTLVAGIFVGFIFHFYQMVITRGRVGKFLLYILDFFLWIIMLGLMFWLMFFINGGEIRVYVLLALLIGIVVYLNYFSEKFKGFVGRSADITVNILARCWSIVKKPGIKIKNLFKGLKKPPKNEE
ncbi:spore cortex biosynthesis protein YabQ [Thermosyntropha sp.]|uniref:spore cortex biosynthesis protein YabQ n=1 Tax=Thermosyntropha sp. TaxID=2740820 RepID=UPI0025EFA679|nr:spore cortex biosynthesis protein YabQ [Thermosyntropha sp.]MBO8159763.1 hypothetical protein [Thermosyntropha sp.]